MIVCVLAKTWLTEDDLSTIISNYFGLPNAIAYFKEGNRDDTDYILVRYQQQLSGVVVESTIELERTAITNLLCDSLGIEGNLYDLKLVRKVESVKSAGIELTTYVRRPNTEVQDGL